MEPTSQDRLFRKIFVGLVMMVLILCIALIMNFFFEVPINSKKMWIGLLIIYIGITLFFLINRIKVKVLIIALTVVAVTLFIIQTLNWTLFPSIYLALISVSLIVILYMTFV